MILKVWWKVRRAAAAWGVTADISLTLLYPTRRRLWCFGGQVDGGEEGKGECPVSGCTRNSHPGLKDPWLCRSLRLAWYQSQFINFSNSGPTFLTLLLTSLPLGIDHMTTNHSTKSQRGLIVQKENTLDWLLLLIYTYMQLRFFFEMKKTFILFFLESVAEATYL